MQKIVLITGPPGAGKSTISNKLAESVSKGVAIDVDVIRAMVRAGYALPWLNTQETKNQRDLATKNVCDIAENSINLGFDVFINDVLSNNKLIEDYKKALGKSINFFLLLPSKETLMRRLKERKEEDIMFVRAKVLHETFSNIKDKIDWTVIDNSSLTIEETLKIILFK